MPRRDTILAIRDPNTRQVHKITKVVAYKEGGFAVLTPYHSARSGYLTITPIDYKKAGEVNENGLGRVLHAFYPKPGFFPKAIPLDRKQG